METIKNTPIITNSTALLLIEEARNAELCRDIPAMQKALSPVWANLEAEPQIERLDSSIQAEILRLCGFFLSYYGHARSKVTYQESGRKFLTRAGQLFEQNNLSDKVAETNVILGLCYWYEGAVEESEAIWSMTEELYRNSRNHPVYLQLCANRLLAHFKKEEYEEGEKIIEQTLSSIKACPDIRVRNLFFNQAGIIYRRLNQLDKAIFFLCEAIKNAKLIGNYRYIASGLNNLGNAYKDRRKFAEAHRCIDRSYQIYIELEEIGWSAHVLDTKAQVFLAEDKPCEALAEVEKSLAILYRGEDYFGLVESLFTKCLALLRLNQLPQALRILGELMETAKQRISEATADKYSERFAKLICLLEAPDSGKRLLNQITPFDANHLKVSFAENFKPKGKAYIFKTKGTALPALQIKDDVIILTTFAKKVVGQIVVAQNKITKEHVCGRLEKDKWVGFFVAIENEPYPVFLDDYKYFGKIIGYCPFNEIRGDKIIFRPYIT